MEVEIRVVDNVREIYEYMETLHFPYHYKVDFDAWKKSYLYDIDGEGRKQFLSLTSIGAYFDGKLTGFIQYGKSTCGFNDNGDIADTISYPIIRNFYFRQGQEKIGAELLDKAIRALSDTKERIYAFFHYFGMSCYARHGKLFEGFDEIHHLLKEKGFEIEHENVFYSCTLNETQKASVTLKWHNLSPGRQQYCDFIWGDEIVGGCEVHFLDQKDIAYLRWIFINEDRRGKGIGSKCMLALKNDLYNRGIMIFDTDTANTNTVAQHFYEKNNFTMKGITRSYYVDLDIHNLLDTIKQ